jgi:hypothetical protein
MWRSRHRNYVWTPDRWQARYQAKRRARERMVAERLGYDPDDLAPKR